MIWLTRIIFTILSLISLLFAQASKALPSQQKKQANIFWDKTGGKKVSKVSLIPRRTSKKKKIHSINAVSYEFIDRAVDSIQAQLKKFSLYLGKISAPPAFTGEIQKTTPKQTFQDQQDASPLPDDPKLEKLKKNKQSAKVFSETKILQKKQDLLELENEILSLNASIKELHQERKSVLEKSLENIKDIPPIKLLSSPSQKTDSKSSTNPPKKIKVSTPQSKKNFLEKIIFNLEKKRSILERKLDSKKRDFKKKKKDLDKFIQESDQTLIHLDKKIFDRKNYIRDYYRKKSHPKKISSKDAKSSPFGSIDETLPKELTKPYKSSILMISLEGPFVPSLSGYIASEISRRKYNFRSGQSLHFVRCVECEKINLEFRKDGKVDSFLSDINPEDYREQAKNLGLDFYGFITLTRHKKKLILEFTLREVITGDIVFTTDYSKVIVAAGKAPFWWTVSVDMNMGNTLSRRIPVTLGTEMGYRISRFGGVGLSVSTGIGFITDVDAAAATTTPPVPATPSPAGSSPGYPYSVNYFGLIPVVMIDFMDIFRARDRAFCLLFVMGGGPKILLGKDVQEKFGTIAFGVEFGFRFCIGQFLFLKLGGQVNLAKNPTTGVFEKGPPLDGGDGFIGFGINVF